MFGVGVGRGGGFETGVEVVAEVFDVFWGILGVLNIGSFMVFGQRKPLMADGSQLIGFSDNFPNIFIFHAVTFHSSIPVLRLVVLQQDDSFGFQWVRRGLQIGAGIDG